MTHLHWQSLWWCHWQRCQWVQEAHWKAEIGLFHIIVTIPKEPSHVQPLTLSPTSSRQHNNNVNMALGFKNSHWQVFDWKKLGSLKCLSSCTLEKFIVTLLEEVPTTEQLLCMYWLLRWNKGNTMVTLLGL
jgi:hypothetical protein